LQFASSMDLVLPQRVNADNQCRVWPWSCIVYCKQ